MLIPQLLDKSELCRRPARPPERVLKSAAVYGLPSVGLRPSSVRPYTAQSHYCRWSHP